MATVVEPPVQLHPDVPYNDLVAFINENFRKTSSLPNLINTIYPVGSIYISTASTNPNKVFGVGTWIAFGKGQVLVGKADSGTFATAGSTGGAETVTLTTNEIPSHTHTLAGQILIGQQASSGYNSGLGTGGSAYSKVGNLSDTGASTNTGSTGSGGAHNNLQPYIVVYMWQRTA